MLNVLENITLNFVLFQVTEVNAPGVEEEEEEEDEDDEGQEQEQHAEEQDEDQDQDQHRIKTAPEMYLFIEKGRSYLQSRNISTHIIDDLEQQLLKHEVRSEKYIIMYVYIVISRHSRQTKKSRAK